MRWIDDRTDVNPAKSNPFRSGDWVQFRCGSRPGCKFNVHHVEGAYVFINSSSEAGNTKIVDYSCAELESANTRKV